MRMWGLSTSLITADAQNFSISPGKPKSDDDAGFGVVLNVEMELLHNASAVRVVLPA
jgi:hypothetical protein